MFNYAKEQACEIIMYPTDPKYTDESIREFQGCPTLAVTKGGRIFAGWYSGGNREPHIENFNLIVYSDDGGKSWSKPIAVIPSDREKRIHALDIQFFVSPKGELYVFWVQNNVFTVEEKPNEPKSTYGEYVFCDHIHAEWFSVCKDPDADILTFSEPKYYDAGFLRCKPLVMSNGNLLCFNYDQTTDRYGYSITDDEFNTSEHRYGAKKIKVHFDETMAYEKQNGDIRMLARTQVGKIGESISHDKGMTWDEAGTIDIKNPDSRLFVARTPSGRVLLIANDDTSDDRLNMTAFLSDDDGETWKYKRSIDARSSVSYPDADFYGDRIYLAYDHERCDAKEILFVDFCEEDIIDQTRPIEIKVISKGGSK